MRKRKDTGIIYGIINRIKKWLQNKTVSIPISYAVFGVLWILLSDKILGYFFSEFNQYASLQTYKGWFYILITTVLLYLLINRRTLQLKKEIYKAENTYSDLKKTHQELVKIETELLYQKKLTDSIIDEAPVFIITHDENEIYSFNPYSQRICGYKIEELQNHGWMELLVPEDYQQKVQMIFSEIRKDKKFRNYDFPLKTKDGSAIDVLWSSNLIPSPTNKEKSFFVSFGADIHERKKYEERVKYLAYFDSLTGLPNRVRFEMEINNRINEAGADDFIIVYFDIDNFKTMNDSMGHQVGDRFLAYFGKCLQNEVLEPDFVARLGGDEFAILYYAITREELLERLETLKQRINKTWSIENYQFFVSMSTGVVNYPGDGLSSTVLLKNADIAMYQAKREGKNRVLFYNEQIDEANFIHMNMINQLQYGIEEEQFVLYYQPQFNLSTGKITGMEVLVRWPHPVEGMIPPDEFIPAAEDSGQIFPLERWIFNKALEQKKAWEEQGFTDLVMSINLSGKTLTSINNFMELEEIIKRNIVNYEKVAIEITETASIDDVSIVIEHLKRLKKLGMKIALDDFGTGYSSLNYLKKFPINIIKLDKSFIHSINENGIDTILISNILSLAQDLGYEVIAEGIETEEQLNYLKKHYCGSGQGYLFGRPAPEENTLMMLKGGYDFEV